MTADNIMLHNPRSEKLTQPMFEEQCKQAYLSGGLKAFIRVAEKYDYATHIGFSAILHYATSYYGVVQNDIAREIGISKGAMSKWCHGGAVPSTPSRKATYEAVMRHLKVQLPVEP